MKLCIKIVPDERGGYLASCPSLPGCKCHGDTEEEARKKLQEAMYGYIAAISNFVPENIEREVVEV